MTATIERMVICSGCSRPLGETTTDADRTRLGPCCAVLPKPWGRDWNNRYTVSGGEDRPEEDDDDWQAPCCEHCGSTNFEIVFSSLDTERGDETVYFDRDRLSRLDMSCNRCGESSRLHREWA